uniref:Uncharacterized protein n=1 Tax=Cyclopterus lumpus TaxID=8103 RepID=A0A8C2XME1_CYCLU
QSSSCLATSFRLIKKEHFNIDISMFTHVYNHLKLPIVMHLLPEKKPFFLKYIYLHKRPLSPLCFFLRKPRKLVTICDLASRWRHDLHTAALNPPWEFLVTQNQIEDIVGGFAFSDFTIFVLLWAQSVTKSFFLKICSDALATTC